MSGDPTPRYASSSKDGLTQVVLGRLGVLLLAAAAFLGTFREWRIEGVNLLYSDLLLVGAAVCLVPGLRRGRILPLPTGGQQIAWFMGTVMLTAGLSVSSSVNGDALRGLIVVAQYLFALLVLPAVLSWVQPRRIDTVALSYLVGLGAVCAFGVVLYFFFPLQARAFSYGGRMASLLGDPNAFAKVIGISVPLLLTMVLRGRIPTWLALALGIFFLGGVLVAASFSGILANGVAMVALFLLLGRVKEVLRLGVLLAVLGLVFYNVFGTPAIVSRRILPVLESGQLADAPNYETRLSGVRQAISTDRSFFLGVGADAFRVTADTEKTAHNTLVLLQVEGGVLAAGGWLLCLLVMAWAAFGEWRAGQRVLGAGGLAATAALFVSAMANAHMYARFWYFSGFLVLAQLRLAPREETLEAAPVTGDVSPGGG